MESGIEGPLRLWLGVALPGPPSPRGPHGTCFSWERPEENSRGPVAKHRIGIMEVRKEDGKPGFCVRLAPLPEVVQGPSVKVSALSQILCCSSATLWFGAQQCLVQSWLPIPIRQRARGSRPLAKERQSMASLLGPVLCRA